MPFIARHLKVLAAPVVIAAIALAAPALARTVSSAHTAATKTTCFNTTINRKKVRECLVPGPRGPKGVAGPEGPRGFLGPKASTGKTGKTGTTGKTGATGKAGGTGPAGATGAPGAAGTAGAQGPPGPAGVVGYAVVQASQVTSSPSTTPFITTSGQTSQFTGVYRAAPGTYCLSVSSALNVSAGNMPAATVSGESSYSSAGVIPLAVLNAQPGAVCAGGYYEVQTYSLTASGPVVSDGAAFSILVP